MREPAVTEYTMNPDAEPHEWVSVALTCFAGQGPHRPLHDTWAIRRMGRCLDVDGDWVYEPIPSERDGEFLSRTRFTREDALRRAHEVVAADAGGRPVDVSASEEAVPR